ncbi:hypothetical protein ABF87_12390 [Nitrosomonas sp. JL21]|uniref:PP0621 family protein n=1 Tax=Nitrosomonas sp. JL21 TaxID=153949 RepID=UPI0023DBEF6E|nr:PP0621 family protein [Nitrosomonas sp. JL21]MXS78739.1 hypothetical protein [Nitrosomonas sp. JL21]
MSKLIFYILLALLIYWIIRSFRSKRDPTSALSKPIEDMVSCSHCNIHLPKSEAISNHRNQYFCCHEHYQQHSDSSS